MIHALITDYTLLADATVFLVGVTLGLVLGVLATMVVYGDTR